MSAVLLWLRAEVRGRWRAWLGLVVLIGLASGASIAAAAGARRTDTAYPRFLATQRAATIVVSPMGEGPADPQKLEAIRHLPQVEDSAVVPFIEGPIFVGDKFVAPFTDVFPLVDPEARFGVTFNKIKLTSGRPANPHAEDEVVVTSSVARRIGVRVGSTLRMPRRPISDEQFGQLLDPAKRPEMLTLRVVGVGLEPGALEPLAGGYIPMIHFTPAFYRAHHDLISADPPSDVLRLRRGAGDVAAFKAEARRRGIPLKVDFDFQGQHDSVTRSTGYQSVALWLLGALTALTAAAVLGQALARHVFIESSDYPTLRALGMGRGQLWLAGMLRAAAMGLSGAAIGAAIAFGLSSLTIWGVARTVEPDPGLSFNGVVTLVGIVATVLLGALVSSIPLWRAAGAGFGSLERAGPPAVRRPSFVAGALARLGFPPSAVAGTRMALEPGRGSTAVPVRTTIAGSAIAVLALAAAFGFSASLDNLVATPRLSGYTWDGVLGSDAKQGRALKRALESDPEVSTVTQGAFPDLAVNGQQVLSVAFQTPDRIGPAIIEGRAPRAADEIALGPRTLRDARARIGGTVRVVDSNVEPPRPPRLLRVVGTVAVPNIFFVASGVGQGAAIASEAADSLRGKPPEESVFYVRFTAGVNRIAKLLKLQQELQVFVVPRQESGEVADLRRVSNVPIALAAILGLMGAATLAHTVVSSVRRRSREFAVLKSIGFVPRQVGAAVAWQATTISVVALVIGLPLGIAAGRWAWRAFVNQLALVPEPIVPLAAVLLTIPGMIVLANLIAVVPGRIAARMRPAVVLRTE